MATKPEIKVDGKTYYSMDRVAKLLGTTQANARKVVGDECFDWMNPRENGKIYVNADNVRAYLRKMDKARSDK